ncbi:hypothetical protein L6452_02859 [Arctium lappa]|uniref:Uncharacterized protein n=1 Tax=Arctium lappa TaxID=4217 RepID=A0ACB9FKK4_ARCLA|nr:hypothetical protein L6452_02859 [Arctium lappa]
MEIGPRKKDCDKGQQRYGGSSHKRRTTSEDKHRLELDQKKKKTLDKQLEFLLGQTERYSTRLAENLSPRQRVNSSLVQEQPAIQYEDHTDVNGRAEPNEDDEHTIEEDEALITGDERREELEALHNEVDLPLKELLRHYAVAEENGDFLLANGEEKDDETTLLEEEELTSKGRT